MLKERSDEIPHQGDTVGRGAAELTMIVEMTHDLMFPVS
jgi:hypothetical protein